MLQKQIVKMLERHLRPDSGVALVAAKRYYFGTGGSTEEFRSLLSDLPGFTCSEVDVIDNGRSNIREVLLVRRSEQGKRTPTEGEQSKIL